MLHILGIPDNDIRYRYGTSGEWQVYHTRIDETNDGEKIILANIGDTVQFWNTSRFMCPNTSYYRYFKRSGGFLVTGNLGSMTNWEIPTRRGIINFI